MKSKEEVIKIAYGEYWEQVKEFVDENGWCKQEMIQDDDGDIIKCPSCNHIFKFSETYYCINSLERCPKCKGHTSQYEFHFKFIEVSEDVQKRFGEWRPKSLQGIESNNGWISINSEKDFESIENGYYHWYNIENGDWEDGDIPIFGKYTHYQSIKRPLTPIY